jgi:hypothetical protein
MSSLASPSTSIPRHSPRRPRWLVWAIGISFGLVAILAAYVGMGLVRMNSVPADLDYSTTRMSEGGRYRASFSSQVEPVPVNELHTWILHVETPDGRPLAQAEIKVDGDMPQHGHGMPTRPQVTQNLGNGDYLVEGMKFQMGGWWVIDYYITADGQTDKVSFNLMLQP